MNSVGSMSKTSYHSALAQPTKCHCGMTSWTSTNPGRKFIASKFYDAASSRRGCSFFRWIDEDPVEWQRIITNQLVLEKKLMKNDIAILKQEVC